MNISARNKRETFERDLEQTLKEKERGQERDREVKRERSGGKEVKKQDSTAPLDLEFR
jgi:hypothetical protein